MLEEARMVVPGVQALFGFQLMSVYSDTFFVKLDRTEHTLHLASICGTVVAMGFVMGPAAYHRQAERGLISERLVQVATRCLQIALLALAASIVLDTYLIARLITANLWASSVVAGGIGLSLLAVWFAYPFLRRRNP